MSWVVWTRTACTAFSLLLACGGRMTENAPTPGADDAVGGSAAAPNAVAQDLSGQYDLPTKGTAQPCAEVGETLDEHQLPSSVQLTIKQDPADLSLGTVMLLGTGEPLLEGRIFDARFVSSRFEVVLDGPLSENCKQRYAVTLLYDFAGVGDRTLAMEYEQLRECRGNPGEYCQGSLQSSFGEATPRRPRQ